MGLFKESTSGGLGYMEDTEAVDLIVDPAIIDTLTKATAEQAEQAARNNGTAPAAAATSQAIRTAPGLAPAPAPAAAANKKKKMIIALVIIAGIYLLTRKKRTA